MLPASPAAPTPPLLQPRSATLNNHTGRIPPTPQFSHASPPFPFSPDPFCLCDRSCCGASAAGTCVGAADPAGLVGGWGQGRCGAGAGRHGAVGVVFAIAVVAGGLALSCRCAGAGLSRAEGSLARPREIHGVHLCHLRGVGFLRLRQWWRGMRRQRRRQVRLWQGLGGPARRRSPFGVPPCGKPGDEWQSRTAAAAACLGSPCAATSGTADRRAIATPVCAGSTPAGGARGHA